MIKRQSINKAVGEFIDKALEAAGLPAVRRSVDDPAPIDRRSVRINLEELTMEPCGSYRELSQAITVYYYPENADQYRDEMWDAVNALEAALTAPVIVDGIYLRSSEIIADMSSDVLDISFSLDWIEIKEDDSLEDMETLEMEV